MNDQGYYNLVAAVTAVSVLGGVFVAGAFLPANPNPADHPRSTYYLNLTISINATTGWPQYTPANFSFPSGELVVTLVDHDAVAGWPACICRVSGTSGGVELVNGTPETEVNPGNVAHTFSIGTLGLNVLSPGQSNVRFVVDLRTPGSYVWICLAPCGTPQGPYSAPPMGVAGYMTGTLTVY